MIKKYFWGLFIMCMIPVALKGQFEQKLSINLSAGVFKTIGYAYGEDEPLQMPNYGVGLATNGGVQFRISDKFSLEAEIGYKVSQRWSYEDELAGSYLYWQVKDSLTGETIVDGENYLDIQNINFGIKPIYYFFPGTVWDPYLFAGVHINYSSCYYEDSYWIELDKRNMLPPDDKGPTNEFLESNIGLGFSPGLGIEWSPGGRAHYYLSGGYYFIWMHWSNFKTSEKNENLHAFILQVGTRINFIKTKDL